VNDGCHFEVPQFYCAEGVGLKNKKRNRLGKRGVVPTPPPRQGAPRNSLAGFLLGTRA
jgi:hypothetical protein